MTTSGKALVLAALGGCTGIYDAQLDDRIAELEAFRTEFLPATDRVQFISGAGSKVYWVSLDMFDKPLLHSFDTVTSATQDYEFSRGDTNIKDHFHMSDKLVGHGLAARAQFLHGAPAWPRANQRGHVGGAQPNG